MARFPLRPVVSKTSTNVLGRTHRFDLAADINKQSLDDIQQIMREITDYEVKEQRKLGNPYQRYFVDNKENAPLENAKKRTEVLFTPSLPRQAMVDVSKYLLEGYRKAAGVRTGALQDIDFWEWVLVRKNRPDKLILQPTDIDDFRTGDYLVLRPKLAYATVVNNVIAHAGTNLSIKNRRGTLTMGPMGYAAQKVKHSGKYANFTIYAARDPSYHAPLINVPGRSKKEQSEQGTGFIVIRATRHGKYRKPI